MVFEHLQTHNFNTFSNTSLDQFSFVIQCRCFHWKIQIQQTLQQRFESHISNLSPVGTTELEVQKYVCEKYVNSIRAVGDQR